MADVEVPDPDDVSEKAADPFARRVALVVSVYAVVLAVAAAGGSNAGKDMMMAAQEASNLWAFYQAKAIREAFYLDGAERIEADILARELPADARARLEKSLAHRRSKLEEYKAEKAEIMAKAKAAEAERDLARRKDPYFDYAEVLMQIAIVLASVSMLTRSRGSFLASIGVAASGALFTANGFALLVAIPFFEG